LCLESACLVCCNFTKTGSIQNRPNNATGLRGNPEFLERVLPDNSRVDVDFSCSLGLAKSIHDIER
jgi:hypothetical protein